MKNLFLALLCTCFFTAYSQVISAVFDSTVFIGDTVSKHSGDLIIFKNHSGGDFSLEPSVFLIGNNAGT